MIPTIPTHLRADRSPELERTELWLKAGINPTDGHKLITQEQAEHLLTFREKLLASPAKPGERWQRMKDYSAQYLRQTPEAERRTTVLGELNAMNPQKSFTETTFMNVDELRAWYQRHPGKPVVGQHTKRTAAKSAPHVAIYTTDGQQLDAAWTTFADKYGITMTTAAAATVNPKTGKPMIAQTMHSERYNLRTKGVVGQFFRYMHQEPNAFFGSLEAQIGAPIAVADRTALLHAITSAIQSPLRARER